MPDKASAAVATREARLPAVTDAQYEMAVAAIMDGTPLPESDPEAVSRAILERILNAETFEAAFAPQAKVQPWRDHLDRPAIIRSVHFNRTGLADAASAIYAIVDLAWGESGEAQTVSCGGRNVLMQLLTGVRKGWFTPERQVVLRERETGAGFKVLWLEDAYADNPLDQV